MSKWTHAFQTRVVQGSTVSIHGGNLALKHLPGALGGRAAQMGTEHRHMN